MDRTQAASIQKCALEIAGAIAKIEATILECSQEDRSQFAEHIGELVTALRFGILESIYDRFPELRPEDKEEEPDVSSSLNWQDVTLPDSITAADLDAAIFSTLKQKW